MQRCERKGMWCDTSSQTRSMVSFNNVTLESPWLGSLKFSCKMPVQRAHLSTQPALLLTRTTPYMNRCSGMCKYNPLSQYWFGCIMNTSILLHVVHWHSVLFMFFPSSHVLAEKLYGGAPPYWPKYACVTFSSVSDALCSMWCGCEQYDFAGRGCAYPRGQCLHVDWPT